MDAQTSRGEGTGAGGHAAMHRGIGLELMGASARAQAAGGTIASSANHTTRSTSNTRIGQSNGTGAYEAQRSPLHSVEAPLDERAAAGAISSERASGAQDGEPKQQVLSTRSPHPASCASALSILCILPSIPHSTQELRHTGQGEGAVRRPSPWQHFTMFNGSPTC